MVNFILRDKSRGILKNSQISKANFYGYSKNVLAGAPPALYKSAAAILVGILDEGRGEIKCQREDL